MRESTGFVLAVVLEDGVNVERSEVEVTSLTHAIANAKYLAEQWPGHRFNVYKLVATHTFKGP